MPFRPVPRYVLYAAAVLIGVATGTGVFTFLYGRGASYLTDDPAACANCHVMREQYAGWLTGSHRAGATCNDCHTPHGVLAKYAVKAKNGFWHSFYFTTDTFHEPIRIRPANRSVTERRCRECHAPMVHAIARPDDGSVSCLSCHPSVGHRR